MTVQTLPSSGPLLGFPSPDELASIEAQVERFAKSNLLPGAIRGKSSDVFTVLMVARDLGLPPTSGLFKVHVVEGKPTLAADLMVALGIQHGHDIWLVESTATVATYAGRRRGTDREQTVTYTLEDATRAGLASKDVWKKNPAQMLRARASSQLCRVLIPDVLGGIAASTEEAEDLATPTAAPVTQEQAVAALRATATPPADAPVVDGDVVTDPDDATDEVAERLRRYAERTAEATDEAALQAVWREADADGLLDEPEPDSGAPLRAIVGHAVERIRTGGTP